MTSNNFKEIAKQTHEKFSLLNATNVFPGIWIGTIYAASDEEFLRNNNIKYILTVTEDGQINIDDNGPINRLCVPMRDEVNFNALKLFPKTCQFIDNALLPRFEQAKNEIINNETNIESSKIEKFDNILVHCQLGISRSPTIVSAYLLYKYYEYDTQAEDNADSRKLIQHLIVNDSPSTNENKIPKKPSNISIGFDRVSSVLKYLQRKRPTIKPNDGFERQLQLWQAKLERNYEKGLKKKLKREGSSSSLSSPTTPLRKKEDNRLSDSFEYLKLYSISKCNDIKYKYLSRKKSMSTTNIKNDSPTKISKDEVAKKLNL